MSTTTANNSKQQQQLIVLGATLIKLVKMTSNVEARQKPIQTIVKKL